MKLRRTRLSITLASALLGLGGILVMPQAAAAICKSVDSQGHVRYAQCQDDSRDKVTVKHSSKGVALVDTGSASRSDSKYGGAVISAGPRERVVTPSGPQKKQPQ